MLRYSGMICLAIIFVVLAGCAPIDKIVSHDFADGYFTLRNKDAGQKRVYLDLSE